MVRALCELLLRLLVLSLPGLAVGALMLALAWHQNPQNEFHDASGLIHWHAWLTVGLGWFLTTTAAVAIGGLLWNHLARLWQR